MKRDALPAADQAFHLLDEAVDCSSADETEAVLIAGAAGLTRFADSRIHQNVVGENVELLLRVAVGGRVAGFRANRLREGDGEEGGAGGGGPPAGVREPVFPAGPVAKSRGLRASPRRSRAALVSVVQQGEGSGY